MIISQQIPQQETSKLGNFPEFSQIPTSPNISQQGPADPMAQGTRSALPKKAVKKRLSRSGLDFSKAAITSMRSKLPGITMSWDNGAWHLLRFSTKHKEKWWKMHLKFKFYGESWCCLYFYQRMDFSSEIVVWPPLNCWKSWEQPIKKGVS